MHFATYGRKSIYSDKSDSVDNQQRMCREYIDFKFPNQVDSFECYQDEGFTGANTNRPGLQRLLTDVRDGLVDAVVVYQLDRLSRDVRDFSNIYGELEERQVMFISIKENIDTATPIGKAMMFVSMTFAQMERETIAVRVTDNMIGLAKKGMWTGGNPPYGYQREKTVINGKKHTIIIPDPEAAAYVESMFDEFLDNEYSIQGMETALKHEGRKTVNGKFFSTTQIHKMLTMPYCVPATPEVWDYYSGLGCQMADDRDQWDGKHGVMIYGRSTEKNKRHQVQPKDKWIVSEGIHDPFIPAEKWLAVQNQIKRNTFERKKKYDIPLLKGTLRCAKCGCLMQVARKKLARGNVLSSYYCITRMRKGVEFCDMGHIKCADLDNEVLGIFKKIDADPDLIREYARIEQDGNNESVIKELEKKSSAIQARIKRLTESLADGSGASKYIVAQIEAEDLSLAAVSREIELIKAEERRNKREVASTTKRAEIIQKMVSSLSNLTADEKNSIARDVISECAWDGETLYIKL